MSSNWTRLGTGAAALAPALLVLSCGGDATLTNRIKPLQANLFVDAFPNSPDPAVYLVKDPKNPSFPDLETLQVRLYASSNPVTFDAYTIEIHFDPTVVQVGNAFEYNPDILGGCHSETPCEPTCLVNSDVNSTGELIIGVVGNNGSSCSDTTVTEDTMLLRIGFIAQTTIADPPGSPIELFTSSDPPPFDRGDCEILLDVTDLGIPCVSGNARMTASR